MRVAVGADHRGRATLQQVEAVLQTLGIGPVAVFHDRDAAALDYTDIAHPVAVEVASGRVQMGILICATGLGSSMVANKVSGVRAALVADQVTADLARRCLDANVLCLGGHNLGPVQLHQIVSTFLETEFEQGGRHSRRLQKLRQIELDTFRSAPALINADAPQRL